MKKYIMTDKGLAEMSTYTIDPDIEKPEYGDFNEFTTFYPFPAGTIGQTYLECEIEFVEQFKPGQIDWQDFKYLNKAHAIDFGYDTRTIARLRTTQVSEFERAKAMCIEVIKTDKLCQNKTGKHIIELIENLSS